MKPVVEVCVRERVSCQGPVEDVIPPVRPYELNITIFKVNTELFKSTGEELYTPRPDSGTDSRESSIVKVNVILERDGTPALLPCAIANDVRIYLIVVHKNTVFLTVFRRGPTHIVIQMRKISHITEVGVVTLCQLNNWICLCEHEYLEVEV